MNLTTHNLKLTLALCIGLTSAQITHAQEANAMDSATVASELNALYNKTEGCSGNEPDYYCSGIILHADDFTKAESWYLPDYRDVGSFSYLRTDSVSHTGSPIFAAIAPMSGYILTPQSELESSQQYPYEVYCSYPSNGGTIYRDIHGCGKPILTRVLGKNVDYSTCASEKVFSIDDFIKKYAATGVTIGDDNKEIAFEYFTSSCSFSPSKEGFKQSMDIYKYLYRDHPTMGCNFDLKVFNDIEDCMSHNELVISSWTKDTTPAELIPIKAFFAVVNAIYATPDDDINTIKNAFRISAEYSKVTHDARHIPVVIIDMKKIKDGSRDVFSAAVEPNKN